MRIFSMLLSFMAAMLLAACTSTTPSASTPAAEADPATSTAQACQIGNAEQMKGQLLTQALQEDIQKQSAATLVRVIKPGQPVTMDFSPTRVNIEVDDAMKVVRVYCG